MSEVRKSCPNFGQQGFLKKNWPSNPKPSLLMIWIASLNPLPCLELLKKFGKKLFTREKMCLSSTSVRSMGKLRYSLTSIESGSPLLNLAKGKLEIKNYVWRHRGPRPVCIQQLALFLFQCRFEHYLFNPTFFHKLYSPYHLDVSTFAVVLRYSEHILLVASHRFCSRFSLILM